MSRGALMLALLLGLLAVGPAIAGDNLLVILDAMARRVAPGSPADRYLDHVLLQADAATHVQVVAVSARGAQPLIRTRLRPPPGLRGHQKLAIRRILDRWLAGTPGATAAAPGLLAKIVIDRLRAAPTDPRRGLKLILISDLQAEPPAVAALRRSAPARLEVKVLGPGNATAPADNRVADWATAMADAGVSWSYLPLVTLAEPPPPDTPPQAATTAAPDTR